MLAHRSCACDAGIFLFALALVTGNSACSDLRSYQSAPDGGGMSDGGDGDGDAGDGDGDGDTGDGDGDGDAGDGDGDGDGAVGDGDGDGDAGDGDASVEPGYTAEEYCDDLRAAVCERFRAVMGMPSQACETAGPTNYVGITCESTVEGPIADGRMRFDPEAAQACLEVNRIANGNLSWPPPVMAGAPACRGVFVGLIEDGEPCNRYSGVFPREECAAGDYCLLEDTCPGTCTPYQDVDDACQAQGRLCDPTQAYCETEQCVAYAGEGDSCDSGERCGQGFYCDGVECNALEPEAGDCKSSGQCAKGNCAIFDMATGDGLCTTPVEEGEDCQVTGGCAFPLLCVLGKCALEDPEGECRSNANCEDDEVCAVLTSNVRECHVPLAENDPCGEGIPCASPLQCWSLTEASEDLCLPAALEHEECGSRGCSTGLWCKPGVTPGVGTCEQVAQVSEACEYDQYGGCELGLQCAYNNTCVEPQQALNEPCAPEWDDACAADLFCDRADHTCQPLRGDGGLCNYNVFSGVNGCDEGFYCSCDTSSCPPDASMPSVHELCVETLPNNAVCTSSLECDSQYCNGTCQDMPEGPIMCEPID